MRCCLLLVLVSSCSLAVGPDPRGFDVPVDAAPDAPVRAELIINEVAPSGHPDDWFEVYNGTNQTISLDAYLFSDSPDRPPVAFDPAITLDPGDYYVQFLTDDYPGFGLGVEEAVRLYRGSTLVDTVEWTEADGIEDGAFARLPDVVGAATTTTRPTPGFPNEAGEAP